LPKIAQHLAKTFGTDLDKDVVRRVLAAHYRPERRDSEPSWLTLLGHAKDSLWSLDLFRTESILLKTHWILVIMDQFTRRIIGFGVQPVAVDDVALCRMFNQAINGQGLPNRRLNGNSPYTALLPKKVSTPNVMQAERTHEAKRQDIKPTPHTNENREDSFIYPVSNGSPFPSPAQFRSKFL